VKSERLEAKADFIKMFIERLGDVENWEHNGIVNDLGKPTGSCVCGHPIRYQYEIINGTKIAFVGSECINHFKDYSPKMYDQLMATVSRVKEEEKKAKELLLNEEIQKIAIPYKEKVRRLRKYYSETYGNRYCNKYDLWSFVHKLTMEPKKDYASLKPLLNWYVKKDKEINAYIAIYIPLTSV
jgi:hypothetical protein